MCHIKTCDNEYIVTRWIELENNKRHKLELCRTCATAWDAARDHASSGPIGGVEPQP